MLFRFPIGEARIIVGSSCQEGHDLMLLPVALPAAVNINVRNAANPSLVATSTTSLLRVGMREGETGHPVSLWCLRHKEKEVSVSRPDGLSQWQTTLSTHLPHLSHAHLTVLALWSFGMVLARSCGITSVAALLAPLIHTTEKPPPALTRVVLRRQSKRGTHRLDIDVTTCFAPLLRWVLAWWPADHPRLVLAMDASTLGQRFTVLAISVVYRGCAIPVAWQVVEATRKGAWRPHWQALFDHLQGSVPSDWTVLVLAIRVCMPNGSLSTSSSVAGTRSCA